MEYVSTGYFLLGGKRGQGGGGIPVMNLVGFLHPTLLKLFLFKLDKHSRHILLGRGGEGANSTNRQVNMWARLWANKHCKHIHL
jgi:hypothetical protein